MAGFARRLAQTLSLLALVAAPRAAAAPPPAPQTDPAAAHAVGAPLDCGLPRVAASTRRYLEAIRSGAIVRPAPPLVMPGEPAPAGPADAPAAAVTASDIFLYPDSTGLLLTNFSDEALFGLMTDASNALLSERGDAFDYIAFWLNFDADHEIGAAFYLPIVNDTLGIGNVGDAVGVPGPTFDLHADLGLAGQRADGWVMMWNVNSDWWAGGSLPEAGFTRLAMGQEFEHRFALFLPPLLTGELLQGDDSACGRSFHWNWKVDGQGSAMEISEWVGSAPAVLAASSVSFNTDIPGGLWSYTDLYLMGYVSPAAMDAGNSQLRFLKTSDCNHDYSGVIKPFSSADLVAVAGPRVPAAAAEQHAYRTGWIMLYRPAFPPTAGQLAKAVAILNQQQADWSSSTLGLGSMDDTLPPKASFTNLGGGLAGTSGIPVFTGVGSMLGGTTATLSLTGAKTFSTSTLVIGFSLLNAPFKGGVMVPDPDFFLAGLSTGATGSVQLTGKIPHGLPSGVPIWYQHWIVDAAGPKGFAASNALKSTTP
jgi:hypothetical protein